MISLIIILLTLGKAQNEPLPSIVTQYVSEFRADFDVRDATRGDYRPLLANVVRLAFHFCVGDSGCDGCIDLNQPDNAGLEPSVNYLEGKVFAWTQAGLSKADLYGLASMVAANMALGNSGWESDLSDFEFGRTDCNVEEVGESVFPDAHGSPFQFFEDNFGFTARETTVIMGAHTLGRAQIGNSGFQNFWVQNALDLGNAFYQAIARPPWRQIMVGNLFQWDQRPPRGGAPLLALNSDIFLVRNAMSDADGRELTCMQDFNRCAPAPTLSIVQSFTTPQGEAQFQAEFKEAYTKMLRSAGQGLEQELQLICDVYNCAETVAPVTPEVTDVPQVTDAPVVPEAPVVPDAPVQRPPPPPANGPSPGKGAGGKGKGRGRLL